jgi:hypothetical protein
VEARIRATLLTDPASSAEIRIRCEFGTATVIAIAAGRSESAAIPLPSPALKDALLAAVEGTLAALESPSSRSAAPPSASPPAPVLPPKAPAPVEHAEPPTTPPSAEPGVVLNLGASLVVESWGTLAYGGRALFEAGRKRWNVGVAVGGLTSAERGAAFVPTEWHTLFFGAFDPGGVGGLRGTLGVGLSMLLATPRSGVIALSATALPSVFGEVGLARPFQVDRVAIVPELGVRIATRRDVVLDGTSQLVLPVVTPVGVLSVTYEL